MKGRVWTGGRGVRMLLGVGVLWLLSFPGVQAGSLTPVQKAVGLFVACGTQVETLGAAVRMWASDHARQYPRKLNDLVPEYVRYIPKCPAAGRDTYSSGYQVGADDRGFTLACKGHHHGGAGVGDDFPRFSSRYGLLRNAMELSVAAASVAIPGGGRPLASAGAPSTPPLLESLPPILTESEYFYLLPPNTWPAAPPAQSSPLRWDFSGRASHRYDCRQTVKTRTTNTKAGEQAVEYAILFQGRGQGRATMIVQADRGPSSPPDIRTVYPGVEESGLPGGSGDWQDEALALLFPVPPRALKVGESAALPVRVQVMCFGTRLYATGTCRVKLGGYVLVHGHRCAWLETEADVSEIEVPPEMGVKISFVNRGRSVAWFDTVDRCFASGAMAMVMSMRVEPLPGGGGSASSAGRQMMDLETTISMSRR